MNSLNRKLLRDLVQLRGQVVTIALVVCCGVASYVSMRSTWGSLNYEKEAYYLQQNFADVFAQLRRAPLSVAAQAAELPGVLAIDPRVREVASLRMSGDQEPLTAQLVSLPAAHTARLNTLHLRTGRLPETDSEALVLEAFADARGLQLGAELPMVIAGRLKRLTLVGTALSPEFVFGMEPGSITADPGRFAVLWMQAQALRAAFNLRGAFNSLSLNLEERADRRAAISELDRILEPYGGLGAIGRDRQASNFILEGELLQLKGMATVLPGIFLGVAAFLLNVVLGRLVHLQRTQIATLKALGYSNREVGWHYLKLVVVVVMLGALSGMAFGAYGGRAFTQYYARFFRFPSLTYRLDSGLLLTSSAITLTAALLGALTTVRWVVSLLPAEAMRPPAPARYRRTLLERLGLYHWVGPSTRMTLREVERRPWRMVLSVVGIAMGVALLVTAHFWSDAVAYLIDVQFHRAMREDVSVTFRRPQPKSVVHELRRLPGVVYAEGLRALPVRVRRAQRKRDAVLWGYPPQAELRRILDSHGEAEPLPGEGLLLTQKLAEVLSAEVGDTVVLQALEGARQQREVRVSAVVDEAFGIQGHMATGALHQLFGEAESVSTVLMRIEPDRYGELSGELRRFPEVTQLSRRSGLWKQFQEQGGAMMNAFTFVASLFAVVLSVGVVYNNARISLSTRSRDLGSLRVLGFTQSEVARILLGELMLDVALALPLGLVLGTGLAALSLSTADPETYRFPLVISDRTYALAVLVTLLAALVSALLVRRKLNRLDLISVLKTRQ